MRIELLFHAAAAFTSALLLPCAAFAGPLGDPIRVNVFTQGYQATSATAMSANGDSVVVWVDAPRNGSFLQRFDAMGRPRYRDGRFVGQGVVGAALDAAGNLILLSDQPDGDGNGIFVSLYDRRDNLRAAPLRVNDVTLGQQGGSAISINPSGDFVIAWNSLGPDHRVSSRVKRYRRDGTPLGPEQTVGGTSSVCGCPSVAMDQFGGFVVTYTLEDVSRGVGDVFLRRFDAAGNPLGSESLVNTTLPDLQRQSRVAMEPGSGQFVVVWESRQGTQGWPVFGQRFARDGSRLGGEFRIDAVASVFESQPEVAMADDGSFVVTWGSLLSNGAAWSSEVLGRSYSFGADPLGAPFVARSGSSMTHPSKKIAMDGAGNFLLGWSGVTDGAYDAYARRYVRDGFAITELASGDSVPDLAGASLFHPPQGMIAPFQYFKITVPAGTPRLQVAIGGSSADGDADLYLRFGLLPSTTVWDIRPYLEGSHEHVVIENPPAGDWYVGLQPFTDYSGVTLDVLLE